MTSESEPGRKSRRGAWIAGALVAVFVLYVACWGLTAVVGVPAVREMWELLPSNAAVPMTPVRHFDPARFAPPAAGSGETLFHVGRCWTPAPFLVSVDLAVWDDQKGEASRIWLFWFFGRISVLNQKYSWIWKR